MKRKAPRTPAPSQAAPARLDLGHLLAGGPLTLREVLGWAGLAALVVALVLHPLILTRGYFWGSGTDLVAMEFPLRQYVSFWWQQGVWPLWNPYIFNGLPTQTGAHPATYPPQLLLGLLLSPQNEIWCFILLHAWLGLLGYGLWLRWLGFSRAVSLTVASGFGLGGFFMTQLFAGHLSLVAAFSCFPWVMLAYLVAWRRNGVGWSLLAGAVLAWTVLPGSWQMVHQICLALLVMSLVLLVGGSRWAALPLGWRYLWASDQVDRAPGAGPGYLSAPVRNADRLRDLAGCAQRGLVMLATAALLTAFQWVPLLSTLSQFTTGRIDFDFWRLPPGHLLTMVVPHLYERTFSGMSWSYWIAWEAGAYLGIPALLGLLLAFLQPWRGWLMPALLALFFGLLAMAGPPLALYARLDPFVGWFDAPSRLCACMCLFMGLLAAGGLESLLGEGGLYRRRGLLWTVFGIWLVVVTVLFYANPEAAWWRDLVRSMASHEEWLSMTTSYRHAERPEALLVATTLRAGLAASLLMVAAALFSARDFRRNLQYLVLLAVVDLTIFANPYLEVAPLDRFLMPADAAAYLNESLEAGRWMPYTLPIPATFAAPAGRSSSGGYDVLTLKNYDRFATAQFGLKPGTPILRLGSEGPRPLFVVQGTSMYLTGKALSELNPKQKEALAGLGYLGEKSRGMHVYYDRRAFPRAFLVFGAQAATDEQVIETVTRRPAPLERTVYLDRGHPELPDRGGPAVPAEALVLPNEVRVQTPDSPAGYLVLTDVWFPGWRVEVDGQPAPLERANGGLHRAVYLPAGSHRVRFFFEPPWLVQSAWISLAALMVLLLWGWLGRR